jgi:ATP synthase protein I
MIGNDAQGPDKTPSPGGDRDFRQRLQRLNEALERAQRNRGVAPDQPNNGRGSGQAMGLAMRLASEFVVEILVGGAIGWTIDHFAGTSPWGLLIFLLLGFAAGVRSLMRAVGSAPPGSDSGGT